MVAIKKLSNFSAVCSKVPYRKYCTLRLPQTPHRRLFLNYKNGKCTTQPVGVHTFGKIPRKLAAYLGLTRPEEYTGHSLRRSCATLLVNGGGDITSLKIHGGWKSSTVAEGYLEESFANQLATANRILNRKEENNADIKKKCEVAGCSKFETFHLAVGDENNYKESEVSVCSNDMVVHNENNGSIRNKSALLSGINISNVENTTININIQ